MIIEVLASELPVDSDRFESREATHSEISYQPKCDNCQTFSRCSCKLGVRDTSSACSNYSPRAIK